jgi:hypothetical protein
MSSSDLSLPAHWQYYAERARQTHHGRVDDFGYGREELLSETLAVIESGSPFTDDCRERLDRLPWNRAKKNRRLRRALGGPQPAEREASGPGSALGRDGMSTAQPDEYVPRRSRGAGITCRICEKAMTLSEEAAYGSRCENCWAGEVGKVMMDEPVAQLKGISVDQVQRLLSPDEWEVESRLAAGQTYAEIAPDSGVSPDALKVRAGRWRSRIRRKLAGLNDPALQTS